MEDWIAFIMGMFLGGLIILPYANIVKSVARRVFRAMFKEEKQ